MKPQSSLARKSGDSGDLPLHHAGRIQAAGKGSQVARLHRSGSSGGQVIQLKANDESAAAQTGDSETANDDRPGLLGRLGNGIWEGVKFGGALVAKGVGGVYGAGLDVVHGVAGLGAKGVSALGSGAEWLGTGLGADNSGAAGWLGKGVRGLGTGLQGGSQGVRSFFGLDQDGNDFTGHVDIPRDSETHTQQYSELGLPMTEEAWAMQNTIDGGKLRETYDRTLLSSLQKGGVLDRLVAEGRISADTIPESFGHMEPDQFQALMTTIRTELGSGRAFLDSLEPGEREEFLEQVIYAYMQRAKNDEDAAFMLELMPTDTSGLGGQLSESTGDALIKGQGPNDFKVGDFVGRIRQGAVSMSESMQAGGDNVYALPVPYANTVPNIVGRTGVPRDGADHLHNYLEHLGPEMKTFATGYSQGGAAVLDYISRYGDKDDLDYALALAPMGGADQQGGDGVFSGERNGVTTLSIMNQSDPAKDLHGDYLAELVSPMWTFVDQGRQEKRGLDGALHSGFYGDPEHPLPGGVDPQAAMAAGTMGYPTEYLSPMLDDLFGDRLSGQPYKRRGDWDYDLRQELIHNGQNGNKLDPTKLRRNGREVANEFLPQ